MDTASPPALAAMSLCVKNTFLDFETVTDVPRRRCSSLPATTRSFVEPTASSVVLDVVPTIQFDIVSLAGGTLLHLNMKQEESVSTVKKKIEAVLPQAGMENDLVLDQTILADDALLGDVDLTASRLQVVFGIRPVVFVFERQDGGDDLTALVSVCAGNKEDFDDEYESAGSHPGHQLVELTEKVLLSPESALRKFEVDLREAFVIDKHRALSYDMALDGAPIEALRLKNRLEKAKEIQYFSYKIDADDSYTNSELMLVDNRLLVSLCNSVKE